jgi:glycosyltransferase involved in cell wall biosynthesis
LENRLHELVHIGEITITNLKVALISEEYPPYSFGGVGTFAYNLAGSLAKKEISTTVFCVGSRTFTKEHVNDFLEIVRLPCLNFPPRYLWFQGQNFSRILRKLPEFSVIHATSPEVSSMCVYFKKALKKPLVTSFHGVTSYEMKAYVNSPTTQWSPSGLIYHVLEYPLYHVSNWLAIKNSSHLITCSSTVLNELKNIYTFLDLSRSSVINNGIDIQEITNLESAYLPSKTSKPATILFYGRLLSLKGIMYLLDAFRLLVSTYPNIELKLFGDGPLRQSIQSIISKFNLNDKIHLCGKIPRNKLFVEIMNADIIALPSLREAQPISVLEAMAFKKPIVAFDLPFVNEYLHDSVNGLLARNRDSMDLASKISLLLSNKSLQTKLGLKAYEYLINNHNWDNLINQYIKIYCQL